MTFGLAGNVRRRDPLKLTFRQLLSTCLDILVEADLCRRLSGWRPRE